MNFARKEMEENNANVSVIPLPVIIEDGEKTPTRCNKIGKSCTRKPYLLLIFSVFSQLNAVYCIVHLCKEMPQHFVAKEGASCWRPIVMGFMDIFTFIRIAVQFTSAMILMRALCNTCEKTTYRFVLRYIVAACFTAFEETFSLCFNISRIAIENMTYEELKKTMEYAYVNYTDLVSFSWGLVYFICFVRPRFGKRGQNQRFIRLEGIA